MPIGLVEAYAEKYGFNPIIASRIYGWLEYSRYAAWMIFILSMFALFGSLLSHEKTGFDAVRVMWQNNELKFCFLGSVLSLVFISATGKMYTRTRKRMWDFRREICTFVCQFSPLFEGESPVVTARTDKVQLHREVTRNMTETARDIVIGEITGQQMEYQRHLMTWRSSAANLFGLGEDWGVYYRGAHRNLDLYQCFAWEI